MTWIRFAYIPSKKETLLFPLIAQKQPPSLSSFLRKEKERGKRGRKREGGRERVNA
jgi:hypothetical protein